MKKALLSLFMLTVTVVYYDASAQCTITPLIIPNGSTTICIGNSVTLSTDSVYVSYAWSTGETTATISVTTSGNYTVYVTDNYGCTGTSLPVTVTVVPLPIVTVTPSGPTTFCQGDSVILSASTSGSQTITYHIDSLHLVNLIDNCGNGPYNCSGNVGFTWMDAGSGTVTNIQIIMGVETECDGFGQHTTMLNSTISTPFNQTSSWCTCNMITPNMVNYNISYAGYIVGGNNTFWITNLLTCFGLSTGGSIGADYAEVIVTYVPGNYLWSPGGTVNTSISVTTSGTYTVTETDSSGCSATSAAINVTVNPFQTPTITASGPTTFCSGDSVQLSTTTTYLSYLWSDGETTQSINVNTSGNYSVFATGNSGCTGTSATTLVTVSNTPPLQPGNITGNDTVCPGTVQAYSVPSDTAALSYVWTIPSGWTGTSTTNAITTTVGSASGNITVVASNGCGSSPASALPVFVNNIIPATPGPISNIYITDTTDSISFPSDSTVWKYYLRISPDTLNTWTYYLINNTFPNTFGYKFTGLSLYSTYTICASSMNHCNNISGWDCVIGTTDPCNTQFNLFPDSTTQHHYYITDTISGIPPYQYLWSWGDGNFDTIPYPSHTYADSGFYTICLTITDSTGCQSTYCDSTYHIMRNTNQMVYVNVIPNILTTTNTIDTKNVIRVYPNPATNILTVHSQLSILSSQLSITNILGEEIYHQSITNTQSTIDISKWSNGIYYWELKSANGIEGNGKIAVIK